MSEGNSGFAYGNSQDCSARCGTRALAAAEADAAAGTEWPVARRAFSIRRKPVRSLHKVSVVPYTYATFGRADGRFGLGGVWII